MNETNEINNALGVNEPENPNSNDNSQNNHQQSGDNYAELILTLLAYAILCIGILVALFTGVRIGSGYSQGGLGFMYFLGISIVSIISWAVCMVIVNISTNIRHIKHSIKKDNPQL